MKVWNILVVDDDDDVQRITNFALKRKSWRGGSIRLTPARSAREARELLEAPDCPRFSAALVDVQMETAEAGLELCDYVRSKLPRSMRLILRTGQAGQAPAEAILRDYDIDYYLSKADVTEDRLYATVRACLRTSQDIECMISVRSQLVSMTEMLQRPDVTIEQLAGLMRTGLGFLEERYESPLLFVHDIATKHPPEPPAPSWLDYGVAAEAVAKAHAERVQPMVPVDGKRFGLEAGLSIIVTSVPVPPTEVPDRTSRFKQWLHELLTEEKPPDGSGVVMRTSPALDGKLGREFLRDLDMFVGNWQLLSTSIRSSIVIFPQTKSR